MSDDNGTLILDEICAVCALRNTDENRAKCKVRLFVRTQGVGRISQNAAEICRIVSEVVADVNSLIKEAEQYDRIAAAANS